MTDVFIVKFAARMAHNGGETIVCDGAADFASRLLAIAGAVLKKNAGAVSSVSREKGSAPVQQTCRVKVFLSRALPDSMSRLLARTLASDGGFELLPEAGDEADFSVVPASAILSQDGAAVIDAALVPHQDTLFGEACVLVAGGSAGRYENMIEFFAAAAAGKTPVRPDKIFIIAGPSKTADIEKQVVLGMHGPKRLVCAVISETAGRTQGGGAEKLPLQVN